MLVLLPIHEKDLPFKNQLEYFIRGWKKNSQKERSSEKISMKLFFCPFSSSSMESFLQK